MKKLAAALLFSLISGASGVSGASADSAALNLLSLANGALIVQAPAAYDATGAGQWSAVAVHDEDLSTGWASPDGDLSPKTFVFELAEKSEISSFVFSTAAADVAKRSAKEVRVEISERQASGFAVVGTYPLKQAADGQKFTLKAPAVGRYLKLTVLANWGDTTNLELMEAAAYGRALSKTPLADNSGAFDSTFGTFRIAQKGITATGCYEHSGGLIENGGFEGRVLRFSWREGENGGPAVMIFAADGQSFKGYFGERGGRGFIGAWSGERSSRQVGACPHWKPGGNAVEQQLASEGRARIYGILFDTGSDSIKAESQPALEQLLAVAKAQPGWKFTIEGHTDNVGAAAQNQALSERRAAAVKAYLVNAGVDAARLSPQGQGASKPVASNETAVGRSQNRRVEVVKR